MARKKDNSRKTSLLLPLANPLPVCWRPHCTRPLRRRRCRRRGSRKRRRPCHSVGGCRKEKKSYESTWEKSNKGVGAISGTSRFTCLASQKSKRGPIKFRGLLHSFFVPFLLSVAEMFLFSNLKKTFLSTDPTLSKSTTIIQCVRVFGRISVVEVRALLQYSRKSFCVRWIRNKFIKIWICLFMEKPSLGGSSVGLPTKCPWRLDSNAGLAKYHGAIELRTNAGSTKTNYFL